MEIYDVNTQKYLDTGEFTKIAEFIKSVQKSRADEFCKKYPEYRIISRVKDDPNFQENLNIHLMNSNVPFYDAFICETMLHKNNNGYIEINEFTYQLNCFCKSIFHRKKWNDRRINGPDKFLNFVWKEWKEKQINKEFDLLEEQSNLLFDSCNDLFEYYKKFVYSDNYKFVTLEDVRELFNGLVEQKIWFEKNNDLYNVYRDVEYNNVVTDSKNKYYSGQISKIDELHLRAVAKSRREKLKKIKSKINFIPMEDTDNNFDGFWSEHKLNKNVYFIPQFLVFYSQF